MSNDTMISLRVREAYPHDAYKAVARIDPETMDRIGVLEGDILLIMGKRKAVARCMQLPKEVERKGDTNEILLTHAVRNNAEVVLGDIVRVAKALNVVEARSVTLTSTNEKRLVQHLKDTGMKRSFPAMFVNTPVLKGDYVISIGPMGPWYVFEVIDIEVATDDAKSLAEALAGKQSKLDEPPVAVITEKTEVIPVDFDNVQRIFPSDVQRRGNSCPVFWIHVTDKLQKLDAESVYLVVTFTCLHLGGIISGQYERKIDKNTDIQGLVMQYSDAAKQLIDIINEEARARTVDASEVKNRIMQKWMEIQR